MRRLQGFGVLTRLDGTSVDRVGQVYRASRAATGQRVAIRVLPAARGSSAWIQAERDIERATAIRHPAVVAVHEAVAAAGLLHVVTEFVPRGSVAELVALRGSALSVAETVMVGERTAAALAAAHALGVVHLGVTSRNLLVDGSGHVKLADFGLSGFRQAARLGAGGARGASFDVGALAAMLTGLMHVGGDHGSPQGEQAPGAVIDRLNTLLAACTMPEPAARPSAAAVLDELASISAVLGAHRCEAFVAEGAGAQGRSVAAPIAFRAAGSPLGAPQPARSRDVGWRDVATVAAFVAATVAATVALHNRNAADRSITAASTGAGTGAAEIAGGGDAAPASDTPVVATTTTTTTTTTTVRAATESPSAGTGTTVSTMTTTNLNTESVRRAMLTVDTPRSTNRSTVARSAAVIPARSGSPAPVDPARQPSATTAPRRDSADGATEPPTTTAPTQPISTTVPAPAPSPTTPAPAPPPTTAPAPPPTTAPAPSPSTVPAPTEPPPTSTTTAPPDRPPSPAPATTSTTTTTTVPHISLPPPLPTVPIPPLLDDLLDPLPPLPLLGP